MKQLVNFTFSFLVWCLLGATLQAQIVVTVAGQAEVAGGDNGPAFDATFNNPHGIAVDQDGNVYTADRWSHTIRKITPAGMVSTFAGIMDVSGDLDGDTSVATLYEPWGICVDKDGNVLVADTRNNKIRKITQTGMVSTIAGSGNFGSSDGIGVASTFGNPTGIECDSIGNIFVADHLTHIIRKIDPNGVVTTIAGTPYVMGAADGPGGVASFARPYGLTLDMEGNILVADEWNHKIRKIDTNGIVTTFAGNGLLGSTDGDAPNASFNYPWDVAVDSLGNVFVADGYNYLIRKITTDGVVNAFVGSNGMTGAVDGMGSAASFSGATALAVSPLTKEIFVGDAYNNLVRKIIDLNQGVSVLMVNNIEPILCEGSTVDVYASPDIYNQYFFYVDNVIAQSSSSPYFSVDGLEVGVHEIKVAVQDGTNTFQSNPRSIAILPLPEPEISIIGNTTFYEGDSVILVADQAQSYFWSNGATTQTITVTESGDYSVEVSDLNDCYGTSEIVSVEVLSNPDVPQINVIGQHPLCPGTSIYLVSDHLEGNQWLKDGWPITGAVDDSILVNTGGIYQVQVQLSTGVVVLSDPIEIEVLPDFVIDFSVNTALIGLGNTVQFQVTTNNLNNLQWNFGDFASSENTSTISNPQHTYSQTGVFSVSLAASDQNGCRDTIYKTDYITVQDINNPGGGNGSGTIDDLFVPTAFTPNGDGENDVFYVRGSNIVDISYNIYNQWGEMVFASTDQQNGWNGTQNGKAVQNGNYVYCLSIKMLDGSEKQVAGRVTVLR